MPVDIAKCGFLPPCEGGARGGRPEWPRDITKCGFFPPL